MAITRALMILVYSLLTLRLQARKRTVGCILARWTVDLQRIAGGAVIWDRSMSSSERVRAHDEDHDDYAILAALNFLL